MEEQALVKQLEDEIDRLLRDQELQDLGGLPTEEEVDALIAVEQGKAYQITVNREPLASVPIIVYQSSSVRDIKRFLQRQVQKTENTDKGAKKRHISWKFIWRSHCLVFGHIRLLDDTALVSQLGIKQNSVLKFSRLAHEKGHHRKAWRH